MIVYLVQRQGIKIQRETFVSSEPAILFLFFFLPLEKELVSETRGLDGKSCIKTKRIVSIEENYFVQHKSLQLYNCLLSEEE